MGQGLESVKLVQGDCLVEMADIPDKSIDMILCDLPYGTTACKWDVVLPFDQLWEHYNRVLKPEGVAVLFGTEPFSSHLRLSNLKRYKYDWVWDKVTATGHLFAKKQPLRQTENICVFGGGIYFPQMVDRPKNKVKVSKEYSRSDIYGGYQVCGADMVKKVYDKWYPKSLLVYSKGRKTGRVHPSEKPVHLLEYLIRTYTLEGETVLDNCMGSGSTGVACLNTGRKFIGIEKDPQYFELAKDRILSHESSLVNGQV